MNIIEALKSGKRVKRRDWQKWYEINDTCCSTEDILADDWEVEPDPVPKKKKFIAWFVATDNSCGVHWQPENFPVGNRRGVWKRVPELDQEIER